MENFDIINQINKIKKYETDIEKLENKCNIVQDYMKDQLNKKEDEKKTFDNTNQETITQYNKNNETLTNSIKSQFQINIENGEKKIKEFDDINFQLEKEIQELYDKINKMNSISTEKQHDYDEKKKLLYELEIKYEKLKDNLNAETEENKRLKKEININNVYIAKLNVEIEDLLTLVDKLTKVRIILNKFFLKYYDIFTEEEKRIIKEIEGEIYPEYDNKNKDKINQIDPDKFKIDNKNKKANLSEISKINNYPKNKKGILLNESEYKQYKKQLYNEVPPQIHKNK